LYFVRSFNKSYKESAFDLTQIPTLMRLGFSEPDLDLLLISTFSS